MIHGAGYPAAGYPADNFTVSGIQVYTPFRPLPNKYHRQLAILAEGDLEWAVTDPYQIFSHYSYLS